MTEGLTRTEPIEPEYWQEDRQWLRTQDWSDWVYANWYLRREKLSEFKTHPRMGAPNILLDYEGFVTAALATYANNGIEHVWGPALAQEVIARHINNITSIDDIVRLPSSLRGIATRFMNERKNSNLTPLEFQQLRDEFLIAYYELFNNQGLYGEYMNLVSLQRTRDDGSTEWVNVLQPTLELYMVAAYPGDLSRANRSYMPNTQGVSRGNTSQPGGCLPFIGSFGAR